MAYNRVLIIVIVIVTIHTLGNKGLDKNEISIHVKTFNITYMRI